MNDILGPPDEGGPSADYAECARRERAALAGENWVCRSVDPTGAFMCEKDSGHEGDHVGFEMPTVTLDEEW